MQYLNLNFYFGFYGGYTAEDEAADVIFSDALYSKIKEIYIDTGETNLESILEENEISANLQKELKRIINKQKKELIELQHENGDDYDPETGEEYDFSELQIDIEINVPEEWDY